MRGARGSDVTALQRFLASQYSNFPTPTGYFGPTTEAALKQWQGEHGLVSFGTPATTGYGAVGPKTRLLIAHSCRGSASTGAPPVQTLSSSIGVTNPLLGTSSVPLVIPKILPLVFGGGGAPPLCTPDSSSPQVQTVSCPVGQTGSVTQTRTSSCPGPSWSDWATTTTTCLTPPNEIYLSPSAVNTGAGTGNDPSSIGNLSSLIQTRRQSIGAVPLKVLLSPGTYYLPQTLALTASLCGSGLSFSAISARPTISGGVLIPRSLWVAVSGTPYYEADLGSIPSLAALSDIRELADGATSLTRARYPNATSASDASIPTVVSWFTGGSYGVNTSLASVPTGASTFDVVLPMGWTVSRLRVTGTSDGTSGKSFTISSDEGAIEYDKAASLFGGIGPFHIGTQKFWLEGSPAFVDQSGEWGYDPATHKLRYYPVNGASGLNTITVPLLDTLITASSCPNLSFDSIAFANTSFAWVRDHGYVGVAGDRYYSWSAGKLVYTDQPAAISLTGSPTTLSLTNTTLTSVAGEGLKAVSTGALTISHNRFEDIGGSGIVIKGSSISGTLITNNLMRNMGMVYAGDAFVTNTYGLPSNTSSGATISFNRVENIGGRAGIFYAPMFVDGLSTSGLNKFNNNRIISPLRLITDAGSINNSGATGYWIFSNYLSGVTENGWDIGGGHVSGVYLDIGSYTVAVNGNAIDDAPTTFNLNCQGANYIDTNSITNSAQFSSITFAYCNPFKPNISVAAATYLSGLQYNASCVYDADPTKSYGTCACNTTGTCTTDTHLQSTPTGSAAASALRTSGTGLIDPITF
jgi:hypothetical protein